MQRSVLDSLGLLAEADLTFDVVAVLPRHLEHVPTIASLHPGLRLVVDHLGKPPIASGGLSPWRELLTTAAAHDNVFAKISGLNTAAVWDNWSAADLQPYIDVALNAFGPGRLMFGGDWPVALLAGDYSAVVRETRAALSSLSPGEQEAIWGGTAIETYKLDV
jgi:L-fuconolactonase